MKQFLNKERTFWKYLSKRKVQIIGHSRGLIDDKVDKKKGKDIFFR